MGAVIGVEVQLVIERTKVVRVGAGGADVDVLDQAGPGGGAVGDEEFITVRSVAGGKIELAPCQGVGTGVPALGALCVAQPHGAGRGAVRHPEFVAVGRVIVLEVEAVANHAPCLRGVQARHETGAGRRAVADKQAGPVRGV